MARGGFEEMNARTIVTMEAACLETGDRRAFSVASYSLDETVKYLEEKFSVRIISIDMHPDKKSVVMPVKHRVRESLEEDL